MYAPLQNRDDILRMFVDMIDHRQKILDRCISLPVAKLNDPVYPGTWGVLENLSHIAWAQMLMLGWIVRRPNAFPREEYPKPCPHDLDACRTALDEAMTATIALLKENPETVLMEKCVFGKALTEQTVGGIIYHMIEHEIAHRAFVYHKLAKVEGK